MKHQKKIEDLLGEVGNFVVQQESVKLSLIPTKLLKKQASDEQYGLNYGLSDKNEEYKEGSSDENENEQESSGEENSADEPGEEVGTWIQRTLYPPRLRNFCSGHLTLFHIL